MGSFYYHSYLRELGFKGLDVAAPQITTPSAMPTPPNRDEQHGGVEAVGSVEQPIKDALRAGRNWDQLTPGQKCCLDMIAHKLGRILSGADPGDLEHWEDLAGYPTAAMRAKQYKPHF